MVEQIKIVMELDTTNLDKADALMKRMLHCLTAEELLLIDKADVIKTIAEIRMDAGDFNAAKED